MKKLIFLFSLTFFYFQSCEAVFAQDVFHKCPMAGKSKIARVLSADSLKNRYDIPTKYKDMKFSTLLEAKIGDLDQDEAVEITAYVLLVKDGGVEACNCGSTTYKDTHIQLVETANETDKTKSIIVEVTPRIREMMKAEGIDWTTKALKDFVGQKVTVDGWLFCDSEHKPNSEIDNPGHKGNWRGTCWEIHPITDIELAK